MDNLMLRTARLSGVRAFVYVFALVAATLFASPPSSAQTGSDGFESEGEVLAEEPERDSTIEEVVIIGKTQNFRHVSISSTSFSADDLKELRIQDITDLSDHTPSLEINKSFAASNPTIFIRGIGLKDYNANSASSVGVYMDGIAINSPAGQLFQMFDIEPVDVLRGPQGSLFGRNMTAGAIVLSSFKPDGEWRSSGSITYGNYNDVEIKGAIGFPVVDEYLQGRVAFTFQRRDGYTRNACAGWDPEAFGFERVSAETMSDKYFSFRETDEFRFDNYRTNTKGFTTHTQLRMGFDHVCVLAEPGEIVNAFGSKDNPDDLVFEYKDFRGNNATTSQTLNSLTQLGGFGDIQPVKPRFFEMDYVEGEFINDRHQVISSVDDLAKLKPYTNNADNWAARMLLRSQFTWPSARLELLLNLHGGQNRSDSFHAQIIGAVEAPCNSNRDTECVTRFISDGSDRARVIVKRGYRAEDTDYNWNEYNCEHPVSPGLRSPGCHRFGEVPETVPGLLIRVTNPDDIDDRFLIPGGQKGSQERVGWYNRDGVEKIDLVGGSLTASAEFASDHWWIPSQLIWINGYEWNDRLVELDGDATPANILRSDVADSAWQISSELRLENDSSRFRWTLGGYFLRERMKAFNLFPALLGRQITQSLDQTLTSAAPFFSGSFAFREILLGMGVRDTLADWNLRGGVRYNSENKDFGLTGKVFFAGGATTTPFDKTGENKTWTGVTGDATLTFSPRENTTLYVKYSRGMKGGHFNATTTVRFGDCSFVDGEFIDIPCQAITAVEPEFIHALEGGLTGDYLDGRIQLSTAFFQYWYTDLQVFNVPNDFGRVPSQDLLNADTNVKGIEMEFDLRPFSGIYPPLESFFMRMGAAWLNAEYKEFIVPVLGPDYEYSGNPTIAAPEWKFSGTFNWEIAISHYGSITPQYSFIYRSRASLDLTAADLFTQPAFWLHNARLAYRTPDQGIEIAAWVRNLTNVLYLNDVFNLTRGFRMVRQFYAPPRMFGVTASYDW